MILHVAPNRAWDLTYGVERFRKSATNRALTVAARAAGKAVSMTRVLHAQGEKVTTLTPVGGPTGRLFAADLSASGIPAIAGDPSSDLRRTVTRVSDGARDATVVKRGQPSFRTARPSSRVSGS